MQIYKNFPMSLTQEQIDWIENHVDKNHSRSSIVRCAIDIFIEKYGHTLKGGDKCMNQKKES